MRFHIWVPHLNVNHCFDPKLKLIQGSLEIQCMIQGNHATCDASRIEKRARGACATEAAMPEAALLLMS